MKKLFLMITASLFLLISNLSIAGIDYIQYRTDFQRQEGEKLRTSPLQHKSSEERNKDSQMSDLKESKSSNCKKIFYHTHKQHHHKHSGKKCHK